VKFLPHLPFAFSKCLFGLSLSFALGAVSCVSPTATNKPQSVSTWQTYSSDDAAYSFEYPEGSVLNVSDDAALRYKRVDVQFPISDANEYQGASIVVLENATNASVSEFVGARYAAASKPTPQAQRMTTMRVKERDAIQLQRDEVIGSFDAVTVLVQGDDVIYRVNLYGGGKGGAIEPSPQAIATFERLIQSFKVMNQPKTPRTTETRGVFDVNADPPIATQFQYPLQNANGVSVGVPVGIVINGARMEWLDYAIRNLDQWRLKCYGVDWSRMLHTGEDWYRLDYLTANSAGSPVYAVADGVVVKHDPGLSYPGNVVMIRHRLPEGRDIYSMYGHITSVRVVVGQQVTRGQQIASIYNQGYVGRTPSKHPSWDSHLHFEMRWFLDGSNIYVPSTNGYGYNYPSCTWLYPGRGYTYIISPDEYPYPNAGYVDGSDFIAARLNPPSGCSPSEQIMNGNFESGLPGTPWVASNSLNRVDPLIYKSRPRTGTWGGWLGNVLTYTDTLSQIVNVPPDTPALKLSYWRYVSSAEPSGKGDDKLTVSVVGSNGALFGQQTITSGVQRGVWKQETLTMSLAGAPSNVKLTLIGVNDGKNKSSFFIDDVSMTRVCAIENVHASRQLPIDHHQSQIENRQTETLSNTSFLPVVIVPDIEKEREIEAAACNNVLVNGDFESNTAWTGVANTASAIYNVIPNGSSSGLNDPLVYSSRPRSGARSGRVGSSSVNGYWNELLQAVKLPSNVTSLTLTYWRFLDTSEPSTSVAYDKFSVVVETDKGIEIGSPQRIDNTSAGRGVWVQQSLAVPNATRYSNQTVWVSVKGNLDGNRPTSLFIDDAVLNVCAMSVER
jgi:murein DD-endopeptidase MepM/ murein hydrolase activator NlpD